MHEDVWILCVCTITGQVNAVHWGEVEARGG